MDVDVVRRMGRKGLDRRLLLGGVAHIDPQQQSPARQLLLNAPGMMAVHHAAKHCAERCPAACRDQGRQQAADTGERQAADRGEADGQAVFRFRPRHPGEEGLASTMTWSPLVDRIVGRHPHR